MLADTDVGVLYMRCYIYDPQMFMFICASDLAFTTALPVFQMCLLWNTTYACSIGTEAAAIKY